MGLPLLRDIVYHGVIINNKGIIHILPWILSIEFLHETHSELYKLRLECAAQSLLAEWLRLLAFGGCFNAVLLADLLLYLLLFCLLQFTVWLCFGLSVFLILFTFGCSLNDFFLSLSLFFPLLFLLLHKVQVSSELSDLFLIILPLVL